MFTPSTIPFATADLNQWHRAQNGLCTDVPLRILAQSDHAHMHIINNCHQIYRNFLQYD